LDERNILATFTDYKRAEQCQKALHQAGFAIVQIDQVSSEDPDRLNQLSTMPMVEWGRYGYQPDTLDDKWTAASSWDNPEGLIWGESWLFTAVVPESRGDEAEHLIRQFGGHI